MVLARFSSLLLAFVLAAHGVASPVQAQAGFATFQFSFSNPGARSLGFGSAFVALADDATAAFANPAGLVQLSAQEISVEGRYWSYSTPYTKGGRLDGMPSGLGLDTTPGLRFDTSEETVTGLSFLSWVYPKERWSLALYRHQLANFSFSSETQGLFTVPYPPDTGFRREPDSRITVDYDFVAYSLAGAWKLTDTLSLGLGLVYYDLGIEGREEIYGIDSLARFFQENSYLPERNLRNLDFNLNEFDFGFNAGFLWQVAGGWSLGGVFRQGPKATGFTVGITSGPGDPTLPPGTALDAVVSPISFPDVLGLGTAYRSAGGHFIFSFEWDRVGYSSILEDIGFEAEAEIDNVSELHLGFEYAFLDKSPLFAIRWGAWRDPDHHLRSVLDEPLARATFPAGEDQIHVSAGFGVALKHLQIDAGLDLADEVDTASVSMIYSF